MSIRTLITEDSITALRALEIKLSEFPEVVIKGTVNNGQEALDFLSKKHRIDIVFMDIEMPVMNGIQATEIIKQKYPQIKIIIITMHDADHYVFDAIKAGADSYILKDTKADKVFETILDTQNGGAVMSPSIAQKTLSFLRGSSFSGHVSEDESPQLSDRESEILEQIMKGLTNKAIADNLFISPFTVKRHIENIYKKLHAHNRVELLHKANKKKFLG